MNCIEQKIMVPGGRVLKAEVMPDGGCLLTVELNTAGDTTCCLQEDIFKLVPASKLSPEDDFMKHQPKTNAERELKELIETAIRRGLKDFWCPRYDPAFNDAGTGICYVPGKKPAVDKSYNWWAKTAKEFKPEQGSRLGTKTEYIAFLAVLIKELVNSGKSVEWAWNAVCNDSKELGHYANSDNAKNVLKETGSRGVVGWYDLANTCKILAEEEDFGVFWFAGGNYFLSSINFSLAKVYHYNNCREDNIDSVGWIVLEAGRTDR